MADGTLAGVTIPPPIDVDARGHRCPVPTLRLRRALETAPPGARVRLLADDPLARIDVPHFAREAGLVLLESGEAPGGGFVFVVGADGSPVATQALR